MDKKIAPLMAIEFAKRKPPTFDHFFYQNRITNDIDNSYFQYIKTCYENSPTNASIINAIANYIVGEGLIDKVSGNFITKIITRSDMRLIALDYKLYGGFAVQVLWNDAFNIEDKRPVKIKYIPFSKIALNVDDENEVDGYWYSFNWQQSTLYPPKFYSKFDGKYKGIYEDDNDSLDFDPDIELLVIQRPSENPYFSQPDYQSALIYAEVESELSNEIISNIQNGFQGGSIINCNAGMPPTEELKSEYKREIIGSLTGTNNSQKVIIAFNENAEQAMTIDRIPLQDVNNQYKIYDETAEQKLIVGHSVPPILFEGIRSGGGFSSNAEEIQTATQSLYRKVINPMREVIIDGLQVIFDSIDENIYLDFKDFESFVEKEVIDETKVDSDGNVENKEEVRIKE